MPTQSAAEHFLKLVERSGIVPAEQFSSLARDIEERGGESLSAEEVAEDLVARSVLTRWQADQLLDGKYKGFILGPYRILRPLGQGGMGTVFLAEHQMMRRRCAVKVLPSKRVQAQPALVEWFYREAQAVAALDHPNIVRAYDAYKAVQDNREIHYLVMEYIDGQDLQRRVAEKGLPEYGEAADWIRQAAEGLAHAHEAGFVHRDIKPANLLVDNRGVVKILDLGLARFFNEQDETAGDEHGGLVVGTADYVAPEQVVDSQNVDARADIYSLGHTFYYLLTGHAPFPEGSVPQRLLAHQTKFPEPIQRERPDVPPELVAIIGRMTAKKPKDRHQTAREVADALKKWLEGSPDHGGFLRRFLRTPPKGGSGVLAGGRAGNGSTRVHSEQPQEQEEDLELAPIEEESQPSAGSGAFPTTHLPEVSLTGGDGLANAAEITTNNVGAESQGERAAEEQALGASFSGELSELPTPTDPLADLLDTEGVSGAVEEPQAADLLAGSPAAPKPLTTEKKLKKGSPESFLRTPVFWVGTGSLALVIAIVWLVTSQFSPDEGGLATSAPVLPAAPMAVSPTSPGDEGPENAGQFANPPEPPNGKPSASKTSVPEQAQKPVAATPEKPRAKPPTEPPAKTPPEKPSVNADLAEPASPGGSDASPVPPKPAPAQPLQQTGSPATPKPPEKPPAPKQDPQKKPRPKEKEKEKESVDRKALFAGMESISFRLVESIDRNPQGMFNMMVKQQALQAAKRAGLTPDEGAPDIMDVIVDIEPVKAGAPVGVMTMSAKLKCKAPNGEMIEVWEHHQPMCEVAPPMLRNRSFLNNVLRQHVGDFFDKFVADYRELSGDRKSGDKQ